MTETNHAATSQPESVNLIIIGAMPEEVVAFEEAAEDIVHDRANAIPNWTGRIGGLSVAVCQSGIGKVNATMATQFMIGRFRPEGLIFTGVAGAVMNGIRVGEVVVATHAVQHDYDLSVFRGKRGFVPGRASLVEIAPHAIDDVERAFGSAAIARLEGLEFVEADLRLRTLIFEAIDQLVDSSEIELVSHAGVIASGDQFISSEEVRKDIQRGFGALCAEMEGGATAYACEANGVPFAILRSISDTADGTSPDDFPEFMRQAALTASGVVVRLCHLLNATSTVGSESSLKLAVTRGRSAEDLLFAAVECASDALSAELGRASPGRELRDWYFDTPDRRLFRRGVTCRVRNDAGQLSLTIKRIVASSSTCLQRETFERKLTGESPESGLKATLERSGVSLSEVEGTAKRCGIRIADLWSVGCSAMLHTFRREQSVGDEESGVLVRVDEWSPLDTAGAPEDHKLLIEIVPVTPEVGSDLSKIEHALLTKIDGSTSTRQSKLDVIFRSTGVESSGQT